MTKCNADITSVPCVVLFFECSTPHSELPDDKFSNVIMDCAVLRSMWFPELRDNNEEETGQIGGTAPPSNEEKAEAGRPTVPVLYTSVFYMHCHLQKR